MRESIQVKYRKVYDKYYAAIAPLIERLFGILDNELVRDKKFRYKGYYDTGTVLGMRQAMEMPYTGNTKIWKRRIKATKRSFKFSLVLDESGSMGGGKGRTSEDALKALVLFMEVLSRLDIDFSLIGFSDAPSVHKYFGEQFKHKDKDALLSEVISYLERGGCTSDGDAVELGVKQLEEETTDSKIMIVITDGCGNSGKRVEDMIKDARKKGIEVIGIGIGPGMNYVKSVYHPNATVETMDQLPQAIAKLLVDIIVYKKYTPVDFEEGASITRTSPAAISKAEASALDLMETIENLRLPKIGRIPREVLKETIKDSSSVEIMKLNMIKDPVRARVALDEINNICKNIKRIADEITTLNQGYDEWWIDRTQVLLEETREKALKLQSELVKLSEEVTQFLNNVDITKEENSVVDIFNHITETLDKARRALSKVVSKLDKLKNEELKRSKPQKLPPAFRIDIERSFDAEREEETCLDHV